MLCQDLLVALYQALPHFFTLPITLKGEHDYPYVVDEKAKAHKSGEASPRLHSKW